jgi:hypothetical protein
MFGAQCEEDREESAPRHDRFAWEYNKLIEEAILGYREDQLRLVRVVV